MQTVAQNSFFQTLCGLFRWSEDATRLPAKSKTPAELAGITEITETATDITTDIISETESLDANWKKELAEHAWPKTRGYDDAEWSDYIPEPAVAKKSPPGQLDMFLHIVKNSPHNTLSEKARSVMKGIRECAPAKLQEIHNKYSPFSESDHRDVITQLAVGSWASLIVSVALVANGSIPDSAAEIMGLITGTTTKAAVFSTLGKVGFNALLPDEKWLARAETIPNQYLEKYLEHASRKVRNEVVKARCQEEIVRLGDIPKKDLPAAMGKLPKLYGRNVLEILVLDQKIGRLKIGRHQFPEDFLAAMAPEEKEKVIHPDTKHRLHLPKKPEEMFM